MPTVAEDLVAKMKVVREACVSDDDIKIMNTPEGQLWNVDVIKKLAFFFLEKYTKFAVKILKVV